ncbi:MAG: sigma-54 dependent transcriptional regulator [Thermodesulfobacteriota bacterium]
MARVLVIDDDCRLCTMMQKQLKRRGHQAETVNTLREGIEAARQGDWDVILLDVQLPDGDGLEYLPDFVDCPCRPEVIIVTGYGAADGAEKAIRGGAWSYIEKPHVVRDLPLHLTRALQYRKEKQRAEVRPVALKRKNIIGESRAIHDCLNLVARAGGSDVNVLITGETGAGKEVIARAIHENSSRAAQPFVVVDCASLPESLIESALFGHVRGSFTGADRGKKGLIRHADGGTLFLDEVGELPLRMQKTFLRVLQEHSYRPIGANEEIHSNFRLLAATNRDLEEMTRAGAFRSDLLFRLKGLTLPLPPLRDRKEDIRELVLYCINRLCDRYGQETKGVSPDFLEALAAYDWPGNVRELFQTIEQVFAGAVAAPTLFGVHLPESFRVRKARAEIINESVSQIPAPASAIAEKIIPWRAYKSAIEEGYMRELLSEAGGDMRRCCRLSGLSRARLYQLINKYHLSGRA